jgi:hypothetical protein
MLHGVIGCHSPLGVAHQQALHTEQLSISHSAGRTTDTRSVTVNDKRDFDWTEKVWLPAYYSARNRQSHSNRRAQLQLNNAAGRTTDTRSVTVNDKRDFDWTEKVWLPAYYSARNRQSHSNRRAQLQLNNAVAYTTIWYSNFTMLIHRKLKKIKRSFQDIQWSLTIYRSNDFPTRH